MKSSSLERAASYGLLYSNLENGKKDDQDHVNEQQQQADETPQQDESPAAAGWEEYEWTAEDTARAEAILMHGLERCRVTRKTTLADMRSKRSSSSDNTTKASLSEEDVTTTSSADASAWDEFYQTHRTNFFKDRHYFSSAFPNEFNAATACSNKNTICTNQHKCLVEVGCGVGNALLPLLVEDETDESSDDNITKHDTTSLPVSSTVWTVHGLDLSRTAIELMKQDARFCRASEQGRAYGYCCDITKEIPQACVGVADVTTLLFCLSAIDPEYHKIAVDHAVQTLKSDGSAVLIFRDYGRYDEAQLKLGSQRNKLLKDNFYRKHDGTKCYYFSIQNLEYLFVQQAGLEVLELQYLRRIYRNRSTQGIRRRVWIQARFRKKSVLASTTLGT